MPSFDRRSKFRQLASQINHWSVLLPISRSPWKSIEHKSIELPFCGGVSAYEYRIGKGMFVDGALYWLVGWDFEATVQFEIFSFNLTTEDFEVAAVPETRWHGCCILGSLGNCLTATCYGDPRQEDGPGEPQETYSLLNVSKQNPAKIYPSWISLVRSKTRKPRQVF